MSNVKNNCTLVVCSCDRYEDLWFPFFEMFSINWANCPYPVVLNTESKSFSHPKVSVKTQQLYINTATPPWARRLIETLKKIDTEYVFLTLDDFFIVEPVNQSKIDECIGYMEKDRNIGAFQFESAGYSPARTRKSGTPGDDHNPSKITGFFIKNHKRHWKCQVVPSIWRRKTLIKYLRPHESAWGWEAWGSMRARRYKEDIYGEINTDDMVYKFAFEPRMGGASAVVNGKWVVSAVDSVFKTYGIEVDYLGLGTTTIEAYSSATLNGTILKMPIPMIIKKTIGVIKSLI